MAVKHPATHWLVSEGRLLIHAPGPWVLQIPGLVHLVSLLQGPAGERGEQGAPGPSGFQVGGRMFLHAWSSLAGTMSIRPIPLLGCQGTWLPVPGPNRYLFWVCPVLCLPGGQRKKT